VIAGAEFHGDWTDPDGQGRRRRRLVNVPANAAEPGAWSRLFDAFCDLGAPDKVIRHEPVDPTDPDAGHDVIIDPARIDRGGGAGPFDPELVAGEAVEYANRNCHGPHASGRRILDADQGGTVAVIDAVDRAEADRLRALLRHEGWLGGGE
jgi:hypothetical protein